MRVFVFEYLTGGGTLESPSLEEGMESLCREGWAMLRALVSDLEALADVDIAVQLDRRLRKPGLAGCDAHLVSSAEEEPKVFRSLASTADFTIVIAPEFDNLLFHRCRSVEDCGGRLLGPSSETVAIFADKLVTARLLTNAGVRTPATRTLDQYHASPSDQRFPAVVKPRFGAGSQDLQLVEGPDVLLACQRNNWLVQAYHSGQSVSVAALCGPRQVALLPAVTQRLSEDGRFRYLGGRLPVAVEEERRAHRLVRAAIDCMPKLRGFVGFDLVLGSDPRGSEDVVIEVNPRLTTSYVGLREICHQILAQAMIEIALGNSAELSFSRESIEFLPDGSVRCISEVDSSL